MKLSKASIPYTLLVSSREIEPGDTLAADCFTRGGQKVASEGDEVDETEIWGSGERNSLVVVLRAIFTWRLEEAETERD